MISCPKHLDIDTRIQLLEHEYRHGLYLTKLREQVGDVVAHLLTDEQRQLFAELLFAWSNYNRLDSSLTAREIHAYSFDKPTLGALFRVVPPGWTEGQVNRLRARLPELRAAFIELERPFSVEVGVDYRRCRRPTLEELMVGEENEYPSEADRKAEDRGCSARDSQGQSSPSQITVPGSRVQSFRCLRWKFRHAFRGA